MWIFSKSGRTLFSVFVDNPEAGMSLGVISTIGRCGYLKGIMNFIRCAEFISLFIGVAILVFPANAQPNGNSRVSELQQQLSDHTPINGCMVVHDEVLK